MPTQAQKAQQERFRAAARQAKREGKKGKSYARRVGELLRGRASHGAGHKNAKGQGSSGSSRPSSSSGGGRTANKPKPRVAVWLGLAGSAIRATGEEPGVVPFNLRQNVAAGSGLKAAAGNVGAIIKTPQAALKVAAPGVVGALVSLAADKLGVNRLLAKARAPVRV